MVTLDDYNDDSVAACKSVLVEAFTVLGRHRGHLVLVGGWVPPLLMPGASVDVTTVVPDVAPLVYLSTDVQVTAAAPGTDANPDVAPASASVHLWAVPWTLLALIILIVLAALVIVSRRRRTPPRSGGRHSGGPAWEPPSGPVLVPSDSGSSS